MDHKLLASSIVIRIPKPENFRIMDLGSLISSIISIVLPVAAILAFANLLLGGLRMIISGGDKNNMDSAKNQIMSAIVGLIVVFASWAVMMLIEDWLGIKIISGEGIEIPLPF